MTTRFYSSTASEKTLVGTITSGQTTLVVSNTIGLPGLFPYTIAVDYETVTEELVQVNSAAGTTLTVTRAIDGTSATSHTAGARVRHVSSARDFSDSRNHENADDGIHGLAVGEEIVGTDKVQTLTNKTLVNATGTLLNIGINQVPPNNLTVTNTPAGNAALTGIEMINGAEQVLDIRYNGNVIVRNPVSADAATGTRRISVVMSDGTTERFHIDTGGQATALPRTGTADSNGGFKVVDPGDSLTRKAIQLRDSTDTTDRFVVRSSGSTEITLTNTAVDALFIKGPAVMAANYINTTDSASLPLVTVDSAGKLNAFRNAMISNASSPATVVTTIQGNATQSARLTRWQNSGASELAYVNFDGVANFSTSTASGASVFTPAANWATIAARAIVKAGIVTIILTVQRTGAPLVASASGDLAGDPAFGNILAAYRPDGAVIGSNGMPFMATDSGGCGSAIIDPSNGDMALWAWSSNGTIATGSLVRVCMTYALPFS